VNALQADPRYITDLLGRPVGPVPVPPAASPATVDAFPGPAGPIVLRPYQEQARDAVLAEWAKGTLSTLLAMATGVGKTETFCATLDAEASAGRLGRALILAHRRELVQQPVGRIGRSWPSLQPAGIVMGDTDECMARTVVATVQTLGNGRRLNRILRAGPISHIVIDEAHHAPAQGYTRLLDAIRAVCPDVRLLGVTATPKRADRAGLSRVFGSVAFRFGIKEAIRAGALCPFRAVGVELPVSFRGVKATGEGWDDEQAGDLLAVANVEEVVVETWKKHATGRPTMAFTASVKQAYSLAEAFRQAGLRAEAADGTSDDARRRDVLDRFKAGQVDVLCNAMLWTEGLDVPQISCLLQVRPTRSDSCYVQMAGRALRLAPGKQDALILDFLPRDARDLRLAGDLLGKPREVRKAQARAAEAGVVLESFGVLGDGSSIDADPDQVQLRVLDYLSNAALAWTFDGRVASATAGEKAYLGVLLPDQEAMAKAAQVRASGLWRSGYDRRYQEVCSYHVFALEGAKRTRLGMVTTWEDAIALAETWAEAHAEDVLSSRKTAWRLAPATEGQTAILRRFGAWREGMSKGEASQAIAHSIVRRKVLGA